MDNPNNGVNNGANGGQSKKLSVRLRDGAKRTWIKVTSTKTGRVIVKVTKGAAVCFGLYEAYQQGYKKGHNDAEPTVVYVQSGVEEEPVDEEPQAEETANEPVEEMEV